MTVYLPYIALFCLAAAGSYLLCFPVGSLAVRIGAVDHPGEHRMHANPTPVVGGAAIFGGFVVALAVASRLHSFAPIFQTSEPLGVLLGGFVIYVVGLVDDLRDISAPAKVAGQVLAAMCLVSLGVTMYYFKVPFYPPIIDLSPSSLPLITALWVVGMANAVNLIDGLDGLAAGIVAIASAALCVYGLRLEHVGDLSPDNIGPLVAALACGACVGFLPHNFHPARLFMGDGGALLLGLWMAAATMVIGGRTETSSAQKVDVSGLTFFRFAPLFIPFFILGVPILDTAFAIIRRTLHRSGVAARDLGHLHHRLVRLGHGHRRAVLILWAWTALLSAFVLIPVFDAQANAFVSFGVAALCVALLTLFRPGAAVRGEGETAFEGIAPVPARPEAGADASGAPARPRRSFARRPGSHRAHSRRHGRSRSGGRRATELGKDEDHAPRVAHSTGEMRG